MQARGLYDSEVSGPPMRLPQLPPPPPPPPRRGPPPPPPPPLRDAKVRHALVLCHIEGLAQDVDQAPLCWLLSQQQCSNYV